MSTNAQPTGRIEFVDAMRGIAVLAMMTMHTAHGWLRPEWVGGPGWDAILGVGGMAAPLFLFLAGVGAGAGWARGQAGPGRPGPTWPPGRLPGIARGLGLMCLGYLLRVQMWLIDGAAIVELDKLPPAACLILAYGTAYLCCARAARGEPVGTWPPLGAAAGFGAGLWGVHRLAADMALGLLRVDVLQGIGGALVLLELVAGGGRDLTGRRWRALAMGLSVTAATPLLREAMPGGLPEPLAAYLASWPPPPGQRTMAMFPIFPWAAYTGFGALLGVHWAQGPARARGLPRLLGLGLLGLLLSVGVRETRPDMFAALAQWPQLVQPVRVAYRLGICLMVAPLGWLLSHPRAAFRGPLRTLGRNSLFVYWVHLELAFGAPATALRGSLGHLAWGALLALLTLVMWLSAALWQSVKARWNGHSELAQRSFGALAE